MTDSQGREWAVRVVGEYGSHLILYAREEDARKYVEGSRDIEVFRTELVSRPVGEWEATK